MAMVRCGNCGKPTQGAKRTYVFSVQPVGYPATAVICGRSGCVNPGLVWLEPKEDVAYKNNGQRIFSTPSNTAKIKVI